MMNNNGASGNLKGQATYGKQIGKTGLDFNLTQPIQLSGNLNQASGNVNLVQTQPNLQKILRQINKQTTAAAVALLQNSNQEKQPSVGTSSAKNMQNSLPRKSSSNKSRRIDTNLNPSAAMQPNGKSGGSSLQNQTSSIQSQDASSTKGRNLLKVSLGERKTDPTSRNPRNIDGMPLLPPPQQSNTNPLLPNANTLFNQNSSQPIAPTLGTESGGGHVLTLTQTVARSASGKRIQRNSDGQHHQSKLAPNPQNTNKFSSASAAQQDSRFTQRPNKMGTQVLYTEPNTGGPSVSSGNVQVLLTEPNTSSQSTSYKPTANYFSQRIQNQLRSKGDGEKTPSATSAARSSKDELLRAFIKPSNNALDPSDENGKQRTSNSLTDDGPSETSALKTRLAQRSSIKGLSSDQSEISGSQFEKITAKASKIKVGQVASSSNEENLINQTSKNTLSQAANSFRAKLLRQQENLNSVNPLPNKINVAGKIKDEPQIIQNALNTLKKSLAKQQNQNSKEAGVEEKKKSKAAIREQKAAEEMRRKEEEKNFGPDDIVEYRGMKMTMSQREEYMEMEEEQIAKFRQNYYPAKFASKKNGVVVTYAANTHQGMVRSYNEDRVSIILNIIKPKFKQIDFWPRCSFFAIYDGHGGAQCADFLRDQLHQMIVRDPDFPHNPIKAMQRGFEQAEQSFLEFAHSESNAEAGNTQRSGSCAIIVLIVGDVAYVANVGDSRAFMSMDEGTKIVQLSNDHKPESQAEQSRIEANGGKVYQNQSYIPDPSPGNASGTQTLIGPHRVFPGRLSVSRTIGDIEAKDVRYGGNPNVVIASPEIRAFKIKDNYDFIVIGCDGVFEKMQNQEVMDQTWEAALQPENLKQPMTMHARCGAAVDAVLNECVNQKTLDNITCVIIGFSNFEKLIERARTTGGCNNKIRDTDVLADEIELDWDTERAAIEETESNKFMSKLMKPLEPVEEEMVENSELETPQSEIIEVTRKKIGSKLRSKLDELPESHTSSVSEKFADSSRRQSQLLESQDTQNLIDHDLPVNLESESRTKLFRDVSHTEMVDQAQKSPVEDQQAGIDPRKSATQIGASESTQQDQNTDMAGGAGGEQGLTTKSFMIQKDYKIRQSSPSPARVQRQSSDRSIIRQPPPDILPAVNTQSVFSRQADLKFISGNPLYNSQLHTAQILQVAMTGGSTSIPVTKTSKTPLHPNNKAPPLAPVLQTLPQGAKPVTPKRTMNQAQPKGPTYQIASVKNGGEGQSVRDSFKETQTQSAGNVGTAQLSGKTNRNSARRRDDLTNTDELVRKPSKKLVANWVDSNGPLPGTHQSNPGLNSSYLTNPTINTSFQTGPNTAKNMASLSKSYINTSNLSAKSANPVGSKPTRQQRVKENIKNLINNTQNSLGGGRDTHEPLKDQMLEMQAQFNTFDGHQMKQALMQEQSKSNSNPPVRQQRKKSGGKPNSLTNKSVRQTSNNGGNNQQISMRQIETMNDQVQNSNGVPNFHQMAQNNVIKQQRSSASRNKPSYLQAVLGSAANSQPSTVQNGASPNISLNMNQINFQTTGGRQSHHPQISQGQISNASGFGQLANGGGQSNTQGGKQWYANTINLAGIKQLSSSVLQKSHMHQLNSHAQVVTSQKPGKVVIKTLKDQ